VEDEPELPHATARASFDTAIVPASCIRLLAFILLLMKLLSLYYNHSMYGPTTTLYVAVSNSPQQFLLTRVSLFHVGMYVLVRLSFFLPSSEKNSPHKRREALSALRRRFEKQEALTSAQ
jgi:hypothetical protein